MSKHWTVKVGHIRTRSISINFLTMMVVGTSYRLKLRWRGLWFNVGLVANRVKLPIVPWWRFYRLTPMSRIWPKRRAVGDKQERTWLSWRSMYQECSSPDWGRLGNKMDPSIICGVGADVGTSTTILETVQRSMSSNGPTGLNVRVLDGRILANIADPSPLPMNHSRDYWICPD